MPRTVRPTLTMAVAMLSAAFLVGTPHRASACGGFFCNSAQPVNQAAERIIFTHDAEGVVTAVIQIQYSGPAERFAWVLPVAGRPTVGVSSNVAFDRLQSATNPRYQLTTRIEGTCRDTGLFGPPRSGGFGDAASAPPDSGSDPVIVVDRGTVGPYDYVVISVDPAAMPLSAVAVEWLRDNGYDISDAGAALLQPYLEGGMNLLAFRLTKGNDVGSIRPVTVTFGRGLASVPIRPTAVAAVDDMGVLVWVLGQHRAVPVNYMSLELNEALIDWTNPGPSYDDVVNAAADEAGGQGFVTEMAGASAPFADVIYPPAEREAWARIEATTWTEREGELLSEVLANFSFHDGMRDVLSATLPVPDGVTMQELLDCPTCHYPFETTDIEGFDPVAFLAAVRTSVIEPLERTAALFREQPYMTRLYTTMSAAEMTRDPAFDYNADLGDVSNVHVAERVIECSPSIDTADAPWRIVLPNGQIVRGTGSSWPFRAGDGSMPANARVRRVGTEGEGEVVSDNVGRIAEALRDHNARVPGPPASSGGICSIGMHDRAAAPALALLALAGSLFARRRRRRS